VSRAIGTDTSSPVGDIAYAEFREAFFHCIRSAFVYVLLVGRKLPEITVGDTYDAKALISGGG
jgi:hypothetical protein